MKSEAFFAFHIGEKIEKTPVSSRVRTMIKFLRMQQDFKKFLG